MQSERHFFGSQMQFIDSFRQFDPIKGELKGRFPIILNDMVKRARSLIKGRTLKEINYAVSTINYLLFKPENSSDPTDDSSVDVIETVDLSEFIDEFHNLQAKERLFGPAQVLLEQIKEFDLSDQESFPKAKSEEYFAILTLAAIGELYWLYKEDDEITVATVGLAVEAMEALTIAEASHLAIPALEESLQKQISLRNSKSGILKHAALNAWKPKFHKWCYDVYLQNLGDESPTRRGAARLFRKEFMEPLIKADQAPELKNQIDLVRTLADSLPKNFPAR